MDRYCEGCIYRAYICSGLYCCDYIGFTGHARSLVCPPGKLCTLKKAAPRRTPNPCGAPRAKFDEEMCLRLYREGLSDNQIARHFGLSKTPIASWRKRNGLAANGSLNHDRRSPQARMAYLNGR